MGRKKKTVVGCDVETVELKGANGPIRGVKVTCPRCNKSRTSYGTSDRSVTRCLAMLANGCPFREDNIYVEKDG